MAERSKALVLGTSLLGGVGSNPTPIKLTFAACDYSFLSGAVRGREPHSELAQRKRVGLITQRSQDRNLDSLGSRLAQLVERKTLNLVVVGSSPTVGVIFLCLRVRRRPVVGASSSCRLLWRSWQRVGLIILRSRVRSSLKAHRVRMV